MSETPENSTFEETVWICHIEIRTILKSYYKLDMFAEREVQYRYSCCTSSWQRHWDSAFLLMSHIDLNVTDSANVSPFLLTSQQYVRSTSFICQFCVNILITLTAVCCRSDILTKCSPDRSYSWPHLAEARDGDGGNGQTTSSPLYSP